MRVWITSLAGLAAVLAGCGIVAPSGKAVYDDNCVTCHGASAQGDGEFADQLLILPPDLTVLAQNNGGTFPRNRVMAVIAGPGRADHFSGAMPEFSTALPRLGGDAQIEAVVDYLETLQKP